MSILINTVNEKYFSLNGIQYNKIYQPLKSGNNNITINNIYDSNQQILSTTKFDEIIVDSVTATSQSELIENIISVIYSEKLSSELLEMIGELEDEDSSLQLQIDTNSSNINSLTSGIKYNIPQTGNTPTNEPTPTENGIYRVKIINDTYTNFGGIVVPNNTGFIYDIQVSGIGTTPIYTLLQTDVNITFDELPTLGSTNVVKSGGIYNDIKEAKEISYTNTKNYPYTLTVEPVVVSNFISKDDMRNFLVDVYLQGTPNANHNYSLYDIKRNVGGVWELDIYYDDGTELDKQRITRFYTTNNPENGDKITIHKLGNEADAFNGYVAVNWSVIPDGSDYNSMFSFKGFELDKGVFDKNKSSVIFNYLLDNKTSVIVNSTFNEINLADYDDLQDCLVKNQGVESITIKVPNGVHIQRRSLNNFDTNARIGYNFPNNINLIGEDEELSIIEVPIARYTHTTAEVTWTNNAINGVIPVLDNTGFNVGDEISIIGGYGESGSGYPVYTTIESLVGTTGIVPAAITSWNYANKVETKIFASGSYVTNLHPIIANKGHLTVENLTIRGNALDPNNTVGAMKGWHNYWQTIHGLDVDSVDDYSLSMNNILIKNLRFSEIQTWGNTKIDYCTFRNVGKGYHNSSITQGGGYVHITNSSFFKINDFGAIYTCDSGKNATFYFDNNYFEDVLLNCIMGFGTEPGNYGRENKVTITNCKGKNVSGAFTDAVPHYNKHFIVANNTLDGVGCGVRVRANSLSAWNGKLLANNGWTVTNNVFTYKNYVHDVSYAVSNGNGNNYDREGRYWLGGSLYWAQTLRNIGIHLDLINDSQINNNTLIGFDYGIDIIEADRLNVIGNIITENSSVTSDSYPASINTFDKPLVGIRTTTAKTTNLIVGLNNINAVTDTEEIVR